MYKNLFFVSLMVFFAVTLQAQNDTMYIMKSGVVVGKYNVNTQVDSIIFHKPESIAVSGSFTDERDGNTYKIVTIGSQVWMAENLKYLPGVFKFSDGSSTAARYYVYGFDGTNVSQAKATSNYKTYGVLYNWPAAMASFASSNSIPSGVKGICPEGWHLPSDAEWTKLTDYLGGIGVAGGKMKESGTAHWISPNTDGTNESGFSALPGGYRWNTFDYLGYSGLFWSSTLTSGYAYYRNLGYGNGGVAINGQSLYFGMSVRCIKD